MLLKPRPKTQEEGAGKDADLFIFFVFEWLIMHSRRAQLRGVTLLHDWTGVALNKTDPLHGNFFIQPVLSAPTAPADAHAGAQRPLGRAAACRSTRLAPSAMLYRSLPTHKKIDLSECSLCPLCR